MKGNFSFLTSFCRGFLAVVLLCMVSVLPVTAQNCDAPQNLSVTGLSASSATLVWALDADSPQYDYAVSTSPLTGSNIFTAYNAQSAGMVAFGQAVALADPQLPLTGLTAGTTYYVYLRHNCEDDYAGFSSLVTFNFSTLCNAAQLPLAEATFDDTAFPDCWTLSGGILPTLSSTYKVGDSGNSVKLTCSTTAASELYSPVVAGASSASELSLQVYASTANQTFQIGLIGLDDNGAIDAAAFIPVMDVTAVRGQWTDVYAVDAFNSAENGYVWVIRVEAGSSSTVYIDNVSIHQKPTCVRPSDLALVSVSGSEATLSWTEHGSASAWVLRLVNGTDTTEVNASSNPFTLTGLSSMTTYEVAVKADCGGADGTSDYVGKVSFTTPQIAVALPYTDSFDNLDAWVVTNGTANRWAIAAPELNNSNNALCIVKEDGTVGYNTSATSIVTVSKTFTVATAGNYALSFDWVANGESSYDYLLALLTPATAEVSASTTYSVSSLPEGWIALGGKLNGQTELQSLTEELTLAAGEYKLTFYWRNDNSGGTAPAAIVDNLNIGAITCAIPSNIRYLDCTAQEAHFAFTPAAGQSAWRLTYSGDLSGSQDLTDTLFTISGLSAAMSYDLHLELQAVCSATDVSNAYAKDFTFDTPCTILALPIEEDFEGLNSGSLPVCWDNSEGTASSSYRWGASSSSAYGYDTDNGTTYLYFNSYNALSGDNNVLKTPEFNAVTGATLSFRYRNRSSKPLVVSVLANDNITPLDSLQADSWTDSPVYDLTPYAGQTVRILFSIVSNYGSYRDPAIDDLLINTPSACSKPTAIIAKDVRSTEATIAVVGGKTSIELLVINGTDSVTLTNTVSGDTTLFTLPSLTEQATYTVQARSVCGSDEYSKYTAALTFTTPKTATALPYSDAFADLSAWDLSGTTGNHWAIAAPEINNNDNALCIVKSDGTFGYNSSTTAVSFASQNFAVTADGTYTLSFDWVANGESSYDYLLALLTPASAEISTSTSASYYGYSGFSLPAGFVALGGKLNLENTIQSFTLDTLLSAGDYKITFYWKNDGSGGSQPGALVDNFYFGQLLCATPDMPQVSNLTTEGATLSWGATGADEYEVRLVESNDASIDINAAANAQSATNLTDNSYVASGLEPNTSYAVAVRAVCNGNASRWSPVLVFKTQCVAQAVPYLDGLEADATAYDCWHVAGTADTRVILSAAAHTGSQGISCYKATLTSPEFAFAQGTNLGNYGLTLFAKAATSGATFTVGITTAVGNTETYQEVTTFTLNSTDWQECFVSFAALQALGDQADPFKYIVLTFNADNAIALDDLALEALAACVKPAEVKATQIDGDAITLDWVSDATSFEVMTLSGADTVKTEIVSAHPFAVTGLQPTTDYHFSIRTICSEGDTSAYASSATIRTLCLPQALPLAEDFEATTVNAIPECWTVVNPGTDYRTFATVKSGTGHCINGQSLIVSAAVADSSLCVAFPNLGDLNNSRIKFDTKFESASSGLLSLGYLTNPASAASFVPFDTIANATTATSTGYIKLPTIPAGAMLAFKFSVAGSYWEVGIDNIVLEAIPSCAEPTAISVLDDADVDNFKLLITADNATSFEYAYGLQGFTLDTTQLVASTDTITLSGLAHNTQYDIYARSACSATDHSPFFGPVSFRTPCGIEAIPYTNDFENEISTSNFVPACWEHPLTASGDTIEGLISLNSYSGINGTSLQMMSGGEYDYYYDDYEYYSDPYLVLPPFNQALNTLRLTFDAKAAGASYCAFEVGYVTDATDYNTFHSVQQIALAADPTAYEVSFAALDDAVAANARIALHYHCTSSYSTYSVQIDNVVVEELPSCERPTVQLLGVLDTEATFAIAHASATEFEFAYGAAGFDVTGATFEACADTLTVVNLAPQTSYDLYVRAKCDASNISPVSKKLNFTTACAVATLPFAENFDALTAGIPACWDNEEGTTSSATYKWAVYTGPTSGDDYRYNGTNCVRFNSFSNPSNKTNFLKTSLIQIGANGATLSFMASTGNVAAPGQLDVYIEKADGTRALLQGNILSSTWAPFEIDLPAEYNNEVVTIIFKGTSNYGSGNAYIYLDDIALTEAAACRKPTVDLLSLTDTEAIFALAQDSAAVFEYAYGATGVADSTLVYAACADTLTLNNLTPQTSYDLYVRVKCSDTDFSEPRIVSFTTDCSAFALPFAENFDALTEGIPACWDNEEGTTSNPTYRWAYYDGTESYAYNNTNCVRFNSWSNSTGNTNFLKTPFIQIGATGARLTFAASMGNVKAPGQLDVYVEKADGTHTLVQANLTTETDSWATFTINLPASCANEMVKVLFKGTSNFGSGNAYIYLDNIALTELDACAEPTVTTLNVTDTEASFALAHAVATSFEYAYGAAGVADSTLVYAACADTLALSNLASVTAFDLYVRVICDDGTTSQPTKVSFSTLATLAQLPYVYGFEDDTENASWTFQNETNYFIIGTDAAAVSEGTKALYVTDDGSTYHYTTSSSNSISYAYRPLYFPAAGTYEVSFDLKIQGESSYDVVFPFLQPATSTLSYTGADAIGFAANQAVGYFSKLGTDFTHVSQELNVPAAGAYNLAFCWKNDGSGGVQPPAAIDNISIVQSVCSKVELTGSSIGSDNFVLKFDQGFDAIEIRVDSSELVESMLNPQVDAIISDTMYVVTGLLPQTTYYLAIRALCITTDSLGVQDTTYGSWAKYNGTTACGINALPYSEDFADGINDCWGEYTGLFNAPVINTAALNVGGTWSEVSTGNGIANAHVKNNVYGSSKKDWLVSPSVAIGANASPILMFDLALTDYYNGNPIENKGDQQDDRFLVAISTDNGLTWNASDTREWNNTGSQYVFDDIPNTGTTVTMPLSAYAGDTIQVAFYVESTVSGGDNDLHIGNINIFDGQIVDTYDTICAGADYVDANFNILAADLTPGLGYEFSQLVTSGAVSTLYQLHLQVRDAIVEEYTETICANTPYNDHGITVNNPTTRDYILNNGIDPVTGCDKKVLLHLTVRPALEEITLTICESATPYSFGNLQLTESGDYTEFIDDNFGCSIETRLHLTVIPQETTVKDTICAGQAYDFHGQSLTESGNYTKTYRDAAGGCDVVEHLELTVLQPATSAYTASMCNGGTYTDANFTTPLTAAGQYTATLQAASGCDSIVTLTLVELSPIVNTLNETICSNEVYEFNGTTYTESGSYNGTFVSALGCDSTVTLNLTVLPIAQVDMSLTLTTDQLPYEFAKIGDDSYLIENYTEGTYFPEITLKGASVNGCDSIVNLTLTIKTPDALSYTQEGQLTILPNIIDQNATTFIHNSFTSTQDEVLNVAVYDATGKRVLLQKMSGRVIELDAFHTSGMYLVRVTDKANKTYVGHVVVK